MIEIVACWLVIGALVIIILLQAYQLSIRERIIRLLEESKEEK